MIRTITEAEALTLAVRGDVPGVLDGFQNTAVNDRVLSATPQSATCPWCGAIVADPRKPHPYAPIPDCPGVGREMCTYGNSPWPIEAPCCWACTPKHPGMIVCPDCGNKRCPRASDHRLPCSGSNEPRQPGSVYARFEVPDASP